MKIRNFNSQEKKQPSKKKKEIEDKINKLIQNEKETLLNKLYEKKEELKKRGDLYKEEYLDMFDKQEMIQIKKRKIEEMKQSLNLKVKKKEKEEENLKKELLLRINNNQQIIDSYYKRLEYYIEEEKEYFLKEYILNMIFERKKIIIYNESFSISQIDIGKDKDSINSLCWEIKTNSKIINNIYTFTLDYITIVHNKHEFSIVKKEKQEKSEKVKVTFNNINENKPNDNNNDNRTILINSFVDTIIIKANNEYNRKKKQKSIEENIILKLLNDRDSFTNNINIKKSVLYPNINLDAKQEIEKKDNNETVQNVKNYPVEVFKILNLNNKLEEKCIILANEIITFAYNKYLKSKNRIIDHFERKNNDKTNSNEEFYIDLNKADSQFSFNNKKLDNNEKSERNLSSKKKMNHNNESPIKRHSKYGGNMMIIENFPNNKVVFNTEQENLKIKKKIKKIVTIKKKIKIKKSNSTVNFNLQSSILFGNNPIVNNQRNSNHDSSDEDTIVNTNDLEENYVKFPSITSSNSINSLLSNGTFGNSEKVQQRRHMKSITSIISNSNIKNLLILNSIPEENEPASKTQTCKEIREINNVNKVHDEKEENKKINSKMNDIEEEKISLVQTGNDNKNNSFSSMSEDSFDYDKYKNINNKLNNMVKEAEILESKLKNISKDLQNE